MFCFDLLVFGLNRNILLCLRQFPDQIKLLCFVPEFLGQNENDLLPIQCFMYQIKMFCFRPDSKQTKSKRFAFVPIISFDIETFILSFRYRWHYYTTRSLFPSSPSSPPPPSLPTLSSNSRMLIFCKNFVLKTLSSQKRGGTRLVPIDSPWLRTQLPIFFLYTSRDTLSFKFLKKWFQHLEPKKGGVFFSYYIQHCFICRPSDSTVPTDAGIEPKTVAIGALTVRRSNH